jgi:hypothetical protein
MSTRKKKPYPTQRFRHTTADARAADPDRRHGHGRLRRCGLKIAPDDKWELHHKRRRPRLARSLSIAASHRGPWELVVLTADGSRKRRLMRGDAWFASPGRRCRSGDSASRAP